ncbi:MAG: LEA type 2 family protein [Chitinophagales bacterium]
MSLIFSACAPLKPVEFRSVSDLKIENPLVAPQVTANFNFFNPNSVGCTIKDFRLDVSLSESQLATLSLHKKKIPANSNFVLPLSSSIPYSELIKFIPLGVNSFQSGKDIPVDVKGNIKLKKFLFVKKFQLEFHDKITMKDIQIK